jgi:hypothetical protein
MTGKTRRAARNRHALVEPRISLITKRGVSLALR